MRTCSSPKTSRWSGATFDKENVVDRHKDRESELDCIERMIRAEKRVAPVGSVFGSIFDSHGTAQRDNIEENVSSGKFTIKSSKSKAFVSIGCAHEEVDPTPSPRNFAIPGAEWVTQEIITEHGVIAAIPSIVGKPPATLSLDRAVASGHPGYWLSGIISAQSSFNPAKSTRMHTDNRMTFEAITLETGVPVFLPEGDVYGHSKADMDEYTDAGMKVEVRIDPYLSKEECITVQGEARQRSAVSKELVFLADAAERGVAPAVLAAFCGVSYPKESRNAWSTLTKPTALVENGGDFTQTVGSDKIESLVIVSQLSTFSMGNIMSAMRDASVEARRVHLAGVLETSCGPVFEKVRELCVEKGGAALVKLNMTPDNVVFCPKLVSSAGGWELEGLGYMPVSKDHLDGVPRLADFNSVLTTRVRAASHSFETAYAMHCMLLVAFARAQYGAGAADILWKHLLSDGDPSKFVAATRAMQSRATNASAFLAFLAGNSDMRESVDLSKALAEAVSDMDRVVRSGVVGKDGGLSVSAQTPMFSKIVSVVTGSSSVDTRIFDRVCGSSLREEADTVRALASVKADRAARLGML